MIKINKSIIAALAMCALMIGVSSCKEKETTAENAGKAIDKAVNQAGHNINNELDKTGKKINSEINKAGETMEKAGQNIQDEAKKTKK